MLGHLAGPHSYDMAGEVICSSPAKSRSRYLPRTLRSKLASDMHRLKGPQNHQAG